MLFGITVCVIIHMYVGVYVFIHIWLFNTTLRVVFVTKLVTAGMATRLVCMSIGHTCVHICACLLCVCTSGTNVCVFCVYVVLELIISILLRPKTTPKIQYMLKYARVAAVFQKLLGHAA